MTTTDVVIIGAGHNGLVAACYLAKAGKSVAIFEAQDHVGGAAVSQRVFPSVEAQLSRYAYLVSLMPHWMITDLQLEVELRSRRTLSYTPDPTDPSCGLTIPGGDASTLEHALSQFTGSEHDAWAWTAFHHRLRRVAHKVFPTLTEPLLTKEAMRKLVDDADDWRDFFERPIGEVIERTFADDVVRGVLLTDALIGTMAAADDPSLLQNICFLYHIVGGDNGEWRVPMGGMGTITDALASRARALGVRLHLSAPVTAVRIAATGGFTVHTADHKVTAAHVLATCAPAVLNALCDRPVVPSPAWPPATTAGSQVKINMVLARLPRLRDPAVKPEDAFAGTFHVNQSYSQLRRSFAAASAGRLPDPLPLEVYCHSLTDPSILSPELQAAGAHTLTLFALHTPHRLFEGDNDAMREAARRAAFASLDSVLAEGIEGCLLRGADGSPCVEVHTPVDLERELLIPGGNIFHTPLEWPFAEEPAEAGTWGVETLIPNLLVCGAGARRGGAVSGITGHNAARAVLLPRR